MANSISDFTTAFKGGFRKNRFVVSGTFPDDKDPDSKLEFHVLAASLPSANLGIVNFPYRGRLIPYIGDRTYEPWIFQVLDDRGSGLYKKFHDWSEKINNHATNIHSYEEDDGFSEALLVDQWSISQLDLSGTETKTVTIQQCWPSYISPLEFNMAETGFNSFAVKLRYNHIQIAEINQD